LIGKPFGPYQVLDKLGEGGMGEVFRARDNRLGRDIAIKILPPAFTSDPDRLARFEREARVLASLNHPHIAGIYGVEESNGLRALVLELVDGETLAARIGRGAVPIPEAVAIARQIADALDAAHERNIVHRDLKPANVALTEDSAVKILDFGLAKADGERRNSDLTQSPTEMNVTVGGALLGTAPYMSPEQARGKPVDKRTDIWSFGCVLYEMLTGQPAFGGETTSDVVAAVLEREPDWRKLPSATPPRVVELLHRCLEKDRRRRLRDIGDASADLQLVPAVASIATPVVSGRRRWLTIAAAAAAAAIVTAGAMWLAPSRNEATAGPDLTQTIASRLTDYGGTEAEAVLSPDGRSFVFVSDHGGTPDIWLRQVSGGDPVRLTNDAASETTSPTGLTATRSISHVLRRQARRSGEWARWVGKRKRS
jgi:serine/threonine protein kinase